MMITLDEEDIHFVFQPMCRKNGEIAAIECLTRFGNGSGLSASDYFRFSSHSAKLAVLKKQVQLLIAHKNWFFDNNIIATVNIDDGMLEIFDMSEVADLVKNNKFIHFELNENSKSLIRTTPLLEKYSCWMDDFGMGVAGFDSIRKNKFKYIKVDKQLFWNLMVLSGGNNLMNSLLILLKSNGHDVIIEGVETQNHRDWIENMPWFALQGFIWPEMEIKELINQYPNGFLNDQIMHSIK